MKLKKLKIFGFKSFAQSVKLEFHEGITAIVGPNGCGKSNIADAFRWVLGEQSAKSLRGGKMQDVIFSGTTQRKPLNFAEVTLTMSGVEGNLSVDYDEVAVTRRLHRSGESDYSINNQNVRLKDVQDLFLDSGIGKDAFAIFEQGKIDQIIRNTPLERRHVFEEAAGILRFLQRKREALRRLEQTDLNVSRLKDILLEIEKQICVLEGQSERARAYKDNRAHLLGLEKSVALAKWDQLQKRRAGLSKKEVDQLHQIEVMAENLKSYEKDLSIARENLSCEDAALKVQNEEIYKTRSNKAIKTQEKLSQQERLEDAAEKGKQRRQELESLLEKREIRKVESQSIQQKQKDAEKELSLLEISVKEQRNKLAVAETELSKMRDRQLEAQQKMMGLLQKEGRLESELKQNAVRLEKDHERKVRLSQRRDLLSKQLSEVNQQIKEKQSLASTLSKTIDDQSKMQKTLEKQYQELSNAIKEMQISLNLVREEIQEINARRKVLERMRADMEGFSIGCKKLLQESRHAKSPLYGKIQGLHEFLNVQKGAEAWVASTLKTYAQTLVVKDKVDLDAVLAYARQHELKDFSLLCLALLPENRKIKEQKREDFFSLVNYVDHNAVSVHFINDVVVAKQLEEALVCIQAEGGGAVLEDGFYIDQKSVLFEPSQPENNIFMRDAELKSLEERFLACEAQRHVHEHGLGELEAKHTAAHQEQMSQDKMIRKAEMSLLQLNVSIQQMQNEESKGIRELSTAEEDLQTLDKQIEHWQTVLTEMQQNYAVAKAEAADFQKLANITQKQVDAFAAGIKADQGALRDREVALHKASDENKRLLHALHVFEVKELESTDREKRLIEEITLGERVKEQLLLKQAEMSLLLEEVEATLHGVIQVNAELESKVAATRKSIEKIELSIAEHQKLLKHKEHDLNLTRINTAQLTTTLAALEVELQDRYQISTQEECTGVNFLNRPLDDVEEEIKSLRAELEEFSDVNLASIEECEKQKSRYDVQNRQIDDLNVSRQELVGIITELDEESRLVFKKTFQDVRMNFQKNFQVLFGGGEADLILTETADVLSAGIEIVACPPGKQMRSIQLLSGGEKCLTAMALLFAIFEVKPAPFCVLDEIDAPLDDANVERFVRMIKHYVDRCQFIIITHNKRTMAVADIIFGVSMEERGVSKLLSLEIANQKPVCVA